MIRPLRLRELTRQKLSQNTVREQGEPSPKKRRADAATQTGMHVPVFVVVVVRRMYVRMYVEPCQVTTGVVVGGV